MEVTKMSDKKKQVILSLDQSTTATGWALFEEGKLKDFGIYKPSGERDQRIEETRMWLKSKIEELFAKEPIELTLVLEDIQMQGNVETFKSLAHLQGVLINLGFQKKQEKELVDNVKYYSSEWKSTCNIKGSKRKEQKENAQKYVLNTYGVAAPEDVCDAICLGEHHLHKINSELNFE
jgi:Holliday junction resolvasome RuvABC endonuclease subunit